MEAFKNYIFANNQNRLPDDPNIPNDYILYCRFNGDLLDRSVNLNKFQIYTGVFSWLIFPRNRKMIHFNPSTFNSSIITTSHVNYLSNKVTLSVWLYVEEIGGIRRILYSNESGAGAGSWGVYLGSSNVVGSANYDKLMIYYRNADNAARIVRMSVQPPVNQLFHLVVVINKDLTTQHKMFVNNVSQTIVSVSGTNDNSNFTADYFRLGTDFKGAFKNLRIYNRELTASEITSLYNEL